MALAKRAFIAGGSITNFIEGHPDLLGSATQILERRKTPRGESFC